jgi:hypothetical protein
VDSGRLSRFMRGERDLGVDAAGKLCEALGLQLANVVPGLEPARVEQALRDLDAGKGRPLKEVMARLRQARS